MYEEFKGALFDPEDHSYTVKRKFKSGNTVEMIFSVRQFSSDGPLYVYVDLRSYAKRKHTNSPDFYHSIKGRDGLEPAMWATSLLLNFPEFLLAQHHLRDRDRVIYTIYWSDSRRRDVYYKWLSRYGFYFGMDEGQKCLTKVYDR